MYYLKKLFASVALAASAFSVSAQDHDVPAAADAPDAAVSSKVENDTSLSAHLRRVGAETGARLFVLGENHASIETPDYIREDLHGLKADGVTTLYIELHADLQPLLDKALSGDCDAQRELRNQYEQYWGHGGVWGAQSRYDLLFEANQAGIKVRFVDLVQDQDRLHRENHGFDDEDGPMAARLALGDAVISHHIRRMDDGGKAVLLIGRAHTYRPQPEGHIETVTGADEPVHFYQSAHGGVEQRLSDAGIKAASIDFFYDDTQPAGEMGKLDSGEADYRINLPVPNTLTAEPFYFSSGMPANAIRIGNIIKEIGMTARAEGDLTRAGALDKLAANVRASTDMLKDPVFLSKPLEEQNVLLTARGIKTEETVYDAIYGENPIMPLSDPLTDIVLRMVQDELSVPYSPYSDDPPEEGWRDFLEDNQAFYENPGLWVQPAAPLAGQQAASRKTIPKPVTCL